ncbi:hypothetical protein ACFU8X_28695, partial [Brevibacillus porteri]
MKYFIFLLFLFTIGCSQVSQVTPREDFENYVTTLSEYQLENSRKMKETESFISKSDSFKKYSQEHFLPLIEEHIKNLSTIEPQTQEINDLHQNYLVGLQLQYEFQVLFSELGEQQPDKSRDEPMYQKLEESRQKIIEWKNSMHSLSEKYQVDISQFDSKQEQ